MPVVIQFIDFRVLADLVIQLFDYSNVNSVEVNLMFQCVLTDLALTMY